MKKTIFITGSSSGIGRATAFLFASKGWNVIATMRTPDLEAELSIMDNVLVARLDVLDIVTIQKSVHDGIQKFGSIDVLLNNAGYGAYGPLESFTREKIQKQFNTNVIGLLDVTKAILPYFRKDKKGLVINISSAGGKMAFPLGTLYHGTMFAVEDISEALLYEVEQFGAKVKVIEPGIVETDFAGRSFDFSNDESIKEYQSMVSALMKTIPEMSKSALSADSVAEVVFEASTDGKNKLRYVVGEDTEILLSDRQQLSDDAFINNIKTQFGI